MGCNMSKDNITFLKCIDLVLYENKIK